MNWLDQQPWYDPRDPYPREPEYSYTAYDDGTIVTTSKSLQAMIFARENKDKHDAAVDAWWRRMGARGARLPWLK